MIRRQIVLVIQNGSSSANLAAGMEDGCMIIRTSRAELGYEIARAKRPDLIAVDVSLSGGTAWTVCRLLKRDPITASIPLVILNVADTEDAAAHARFVGASAVFAETASTKECPSAVHEVLTESSAA